MPKGEKKSAQERLRDTYDGFDSSESRIPAPVDRRRRWKWKKRIERRERKRERPETSRAHNRTGEKRESLNDYALRRIETA
jgi:hypothetical protein